MNIRKISSLVNSDYIYKDIINQSICVGDIIAISGSRLKRGYVYNVTKKNIKTYDIDKLIENKLVLAKSLTITRNYCLNITKMFSKQEIIDIENKIKYIKDTHGTALNTTYYILFLLYSKNELGFYIAETKGNLKLSLNNAIKKIENKYPGFEYIPYSKYDTFFRDYKIKDVKFFSASNGIFDLYNKFYLLNNNTFHLIDKFIVMKKINNDWKFFMHKNETGMCNNQINRYFVDSNIINDISGKELMPCVGAGNYRFLGYGSYFKKDHILGCLNNFLRLELN